MLIIIHPVVYWLFVYAVFYGISLSIAETLKMISAIVEGADSEDMNKMEWKKCIPLAFVLSISWGVFLMFFLQ